MWYLVMFFRYYLTASLDWQERMFTKLFCNKGYHCGCYLKGERCCECGSHYTERISDKQVKEVYNQTRQSER